jgi:hypothetical protein
MFKKIFFIVIFSFIAMSMKKFDYVVKVGDECLNVRVCCDNYRDNSDGSRTLYPPWEITNTDLGTLSSSTNMAMSIRPCPNIAIEGTKIICNDDELQLNNKESSNVFIYDVDGKCVYSAKDKINFTLDKSTLKLLNGYYTLRLKNKDGIETIVPFMFTNGSFIISEPKK